MKNKRYMLISIIVILVSWKLISFIVNNSIKIPSPEETVIALVNIVTGKYFFLQLISSLRRLLIGFCVSFVLALILGLVSGFIDPVYYLLKPIVLTQRAVPTMAVILLSLIWLNREIAPVLVGVMVIFPIIYSSVVNGVREVDRHLLEMCNVYQMSHKKQLIHLYIPSIKSALLSVSAAAVSLNVKIIIAAEVLSQPKYSIGTGFQMERVAFNTAGVFAWAIIAILLAGFFEYLVSLRFLKWFQR